MKNLVYFTILMYSGFVFGQSGAKIMFKNTDNIIDFGTVLKTNDNGIRTFEFMNTGDADLKIRSVISTFGCVAKNNNEIVAPGQSGFIVVKCGLVVGTLRKTIVIESNAVNVNQGVVKLTIKGEVLK
jgi:Protein of unknown function (DUF1573)